MNRQAVTSSNIKSIGWEHQPTSRGSVDVEGQRIEFGLLEAEYINGSVYQYKDVPHGVYARIMAANGPDKAGPTVGQLWYQLIRLGGYEYKQVEPPTPKPCAPISEQVQS